MRGGLGASTWTASAAPSEGLQCRTPWPARLPQRVLSPELLANYTEPLFKVALARVGAPSLLFPDYFLL